MHTLSILFTLGLFLVGVETRAAPAEFNVQKAYLDSDAQAAARKLHSSGGNILVQITHKETEDSGERCYIKSVAEGDQESEDLGWVWCMHLNRTN